MKDEHDFSKGKRGAIDKGFEKWKEKNLFKLIDTALPSHDPPFNEYEDFARVIFQAGMAHYAQNDLAGDERKRIVEIFKPWLDSMAPVDRQNILDRIEKESK
ncbi:MAG: hypothetical protein JRE23_14420 [Deltaproteobacteria bacterium]|nr:hypothetical protein [Deltaproteobacteria bacterium]